MRNLLIEIAIEDEGMEEISDINLYHDPNAPKKVISIKRNFITNKEWTTYYNDQIGTIKFHNLPDEYKDPLEKMVEERKRNHLANINRNQQPYQVCLHDNCPLCWGTGITSTGTSCLHSLVCHCPKCNSVY